MRDFRRSIKNSWINKLIHDKLECQLEETNIFQRNKSYTKDQMYDSSNTTSRQLLYKIYIYI